MSEVKKQVLHGVGWNFIEQTGVHLIVFSGTVVLSRLLAPEIFGLYAMLTVAGSLGTLLVSLGISYSVIQNQDLTRHDLSGLFWLTVMAGLAGAILFFLCAGQIAAFYHQPELSDVARFFCLGLIAQSVNSVPQGLLIKSLNFKKLAMTNIVATVGSYAVAIGLAISKLGVWALVCQFLIQQYLITILNFFHSRWRPRLVFDPSVIHKIKRFSVNFTAAQLLDFAATHIDAVLIGKSLGKYNLGLYSRSAALITFPVTSFGYILNRTFFSWFSSLQNKVSELQLRYFQALQALVLFMAPLLLLVGLQAEEVVRFIFGPQWMDMVPLVGFFSLIGFAQCINAFHDSFLISQGRADMLLRINTIEKVLLIGVVFIGLQYGLMGVVYAKSLALMLIIMPRILIVAAVLQSHFILWLKKFSGNALALAVMYASIKATQYVVCCSLHFILRLVVVSVVALLVYTLTLRFLRNSTWLELERLFKEQYRKFRKPNS